MIKKRAFAKNTWQDWLNNFIPKAIKKLLKGKLGIFLKQTQPKIIISIYLLTMCMGVEQNQENQR